jgi:CYTH domain-containing protein
MPATPNMYASATPPKCARNCRESCASEKVGASAVPPKYLLASLPDRVTRTFEIVDRYISRTRLRLRELRDEDGRVTRKLGHKVRLSDGPAEVACTNMYLNEQEWDLLSSLPARLLRKQRHVVQHDGLTVAIDEYDDGTLVAEIDDRNQPAQPVPAWLTVVVDVMMTSNGRVQRSRAES